MDIELIDMYKGRPTRSSSTITRSRTIYFQLQQKYISQKATSDDVEISLQRILIKASQLMLQRKWIQLIQLCNTGLAVHEDAELYSMKGRAQGKLGNYSAKVQLTKKAIQLNPKNPNYYRNLGAGYYKLQKFQDSLTNHMKSIEMEPNNSINHHNVGAVLFRLKRFDEAVVYFKKSIQLNKYQAQSYRWLGNTYKQKQQYQKALQCFQRAYDLSEKEMDGIQIKQLEKRLYPWKVFFNNLFFC